MTDVSEVPTPFFIDIMMEAVNISETLVNFYENTQRDIPDDSQLVPVRLFLVLQCERGRGSLESVTFPLGYGN
jgi:hypothetical protein